MPNMPIVRHSTSTPGEQRLTDQAERDLRPSKVQQNVSGRLTSEERTRDRYTIRGYVSTATKACLNMITVLRDALLGRRAAVVLRWLLDAARIGDLAVDNEGSSSTAYRYLHEAIDVPAAAAPTCRERCSRPAPPGRPV
jgi:hypothetical protein